MNGTRIPVAFVVNDFLMGGAQKLLTDIFKYFDNDTYEVHLITLFDFPDRPTLFHLLPPEIRIHTVGMQGIFDIAGWRRLASLLKTQGFCAIVSHLFFANTVTRIVTFFDHVPTITVEHNTYTNKNFLQHSVDWLLAHRTYRIVAVSAEVARFLVRTQHVPLRNIVVIPNGIDFEDLKSHTTLESKETLRASMGLPTDALIVVQVGRLVAQKNPLLALEGFALFSKQTTSRAYFIIVGDGELRGALESTAKRLDVSDQVLFVGTTEPYAYYQVADLFLSTPLIEGFGLVRAEALWYGLPVVTTATGGTDELIQDGSNGVLIENSTPESVAKALGRALVLDRSSMQKQARLTAQNFSIKRTADAYGILIGEAIHAHKAKRLI